MTQDLLEKLAGALAKETDGAHVTPELTRTRVMRRLDEQRRKRRMRLVIMAPLLGLGLGSTALAASSAEFRAVVGSIPEFFGSSSAARSRHIEATAQHRAHPSRSPDSTIDSPPVPIKAAEIPEPDAPPAAAEAALDSAQRTRKATPFTAGSQTLAHTKTTADDGAERGAASASPPLAVPESNLGLALYRQAHDAQFKAGNHRAALTGYRAYLNEYATGPLSAEASYNAALCEVQLGQNSAARRSLTPFARGAYGPYRQEEARALLEALPLPP